MGGIFCCLLKKPMLKHVLSVSIMASFSILTLPFNSSFLCEDEDEVPDGIGSRVHCDLQILLSVVTSLASFLLGGLKSSILFAKSLTTSASIAESKKNIYLTYPV